MKKMLFVMNPAAGMKKANRQLTEIITIFNRGGYHVTTYMTAGPGDCARYVRENAGQYDTVVCCGGDGTFNEAISGLLRAGLEVPLGYIPAGSTNDFAASIRLPNAPLQAAQLIVDGKPQPYDLGRFGHDRFFSYVASFGAFTRASYSTPQDIKNALGHTAYLLEGIQELSQIRPEHIRIDADGRIIEDDFLFGAICNSTSVGGILTLDPRQVDMSDGKFELLLIRAPRDLLEISKCIRAVRTQSYNCAMMTFLPAQNLRIWADPAMNWTLDGEMALGQQEFEIENLHHAFQLINREVTV